MNFRLSSVLVLVGPMLLFGCSEPIEKRYSNKIFRSENMPTTGLTLYWSGAASIVVDDGKNSILIDPFVSRKENNALDIALRRKAEVNVAAISNRVQRPEIARAKAIFVGHTHYDHSLDVSDFANLLQVPIYGSPSMKRILKAHRNSQDLEFIVQKEFQTYHIQGGFKVTVLPGAHGQPPACLGSLCIDPLEEVVADQFNLPAAVNDFGLGEVVTFLVEHKQGNVLHIGTAAIVPKSFDHLKGRVDVVILSLVGRNERYIYEVLDTVEPRFVVPIHYDNLFKPIEDGVHVVKVADLEGYFEELEQDFPNISTGVVLFDMAWVLPSRQNSAN
ncbi:MBL fold metallo-hydrolase [Roseibium sp. RKSG952]|uniref:MBL fold metallo-hydrolase n=1 Tax=Roseibium sp. RKSG952 TaxID=2529384 RepID=UPI0012BC4540|nr:MBL fold metallo-hydrolase [Roseibium sp. RKSG952]MTI03209.1 MBL fold metallo-hydrolase [Roseibium sp. RKSG952]